MRTYQGGHQGSSEPDGIPLAFMADHVNLDTGRLCVGSLACGQTRGTGKTTNPL